jgi:membrane-associated protease RseP (regulator of RpoE activity)
MLTVVTCTVAGVALTHRPAPLSMLTALTLLRHDPNRLWDGVSFSGPLLAILLSHEMGHYAAARLWHARASWPVFIPLPVGLGTMGALIHMDAQGQDRRGLLEIGAGGPLVGFVVACAFLLLGLASSGVKTAEEMGVLVGLGGMVVPESVAYAVSKWLVFGTLPPDREVVPGPMALAGWFGLYLTWFNLLPYGQLDGGHLAFSAAPRGARWISWLVVLGCVGMALLTRSMAWAVVGTGLLLLGALAGTSHPEMEDVEPPLGARQWAVLVACVLVFALCFMPNPLPGPGR